MQQLKSVGNAVANLERTCSEIRKHVSAAKLATAPMLSESDALLAQKEQLETKQALLNAFNIHFLLSDSELLTLTSGAEPVTDEFFQVLVKAKRIHRDCQVLLGSESQHLGVEIIDQRTKELNVAFQKLYRWVQREFKSLDLENPHMSSSIRRALRVLAERPTLFQSCLDTFAESREHTLSEAFYSALTGSVLTAPSQDVDFRKPIEFSAHEPLRYVGDMLAWVHSAAVSEREALEGLFISEGSEISKSIQAGLESEPWSRQGGKSADSSDDEEEEAVPEVFDGRKALEQLVDRSLAGVAQLLRQRIEQVIHTHDEPVLAYRISNLIAYYRGVFARMVARSAGFTEALHSMHNIALDHFRTTMRYQISAAQSETLVAPEDLSPPEFLIESLGELATLLKSYDTSRASASTDESALDIVLTEALDPFLVSCDSLSRSLPAPKDNIFAVNCLLATKTALSAFPFVNAKQTDLDDTTEEHALSLVNYLHGFFIHHSGLRPLLAALAQLHEMPENVEVDVATTLPTLSAFSESNIISASEKLDDFLPSALMDAAEEVKQLASIGLARELTNEAADRFCQDFEGLEEWIIRADEATRGNEDAKEDGSSTEVVQEGERTGPLKLRDMFPRTSGEMRILLS